MLTRAIVVDLQSTKVSFPISTQTATITATAAIFTASKKAEMYLDFLSLGISGFKMLTKTKEGKNIPMLAATAPQIPFN